MQFTELAEKEALQYCINNSIRSEEISSESIWVDLGSEGEEIVLGVVYRPPNTNREESSLLWQEINSAYRKERICVLGTFNLRNIE